jgi:ATP-dependent DNA helicase RecG
MTGLFSQEIKYLAGVGPKRAELLQEELQITTFGDLLYYFPYKYVDRTRFFTIRELNAAQAYIQVRGRFLNLAVTGIKGGKRLVGQFADDTGILEVVWFKGTKWILESIRPGVTYILFGKPSEYGGKLNIVHPEIEEEAKWEKAINTSLQAFYNTSEKLKDHFLNSKAILKLQNTLLKMVGNNIPETLPPYLVNRLKLIPLREALVQIHFPADQAQLAKAQYRLKFEELFYIQLNILKQKGMRTEKSNGFVFATVGEIFNNFFHNHLNFELTNAQKRVLKEIRKDLNSGRQMNRLLQGDVGSGKTLVALMTILIALDNGYQTCLMAPTEILANQHFETLSRFLDGMDINLQLLTGSVKKARRKTIHEELENGKLQILVGTHALIEDAVQFKNLGLVIIDEQHRFGVAQRARLWKKNLNPPHVLVMTATPIPRTLAMTLYGDLDVSVIDELPPGRKPVKTLMMNDSQRLRLFGFMKEEIKKGRQVYVVYPLISESEKMDYKDLEDGYESIVRAFPPPEFAVSCVHGRMHGDEKEISMAYFVKGITHIMVATTVIEVGVDVPNATVMVIESAERFGLSQLHQLRGRVGRGAGQSYCILMASHKLGDDSRKRLEIMVRTNSGFEIAEEDLKLRGPGDIEGTQQSGIPFDLKIANLAQDGKLLQYARDIAEQLLTDDPHLSKPENSVILSTLRAQVRNKVYWGEIS